ncbi:MAG: TonB-dependent receptor, partial [Calditrichia bacterium]
REWSAFVEQDDYLKDNKGKIADRFGALNPWYANVDLRLLQDFVFGSPGSQHRFQLSLDFLNVLNLLSSEWGVRSVANSAATSPLEFVRLEGNEPVFNYKAVATETYTDDLSQFSRWRIQVGLRYLFN